MSGAVDFDPFDLTDASCAGADPFGIVGDAPVDEFPEFKVWTRKIPFLSVEQSARVAERLKRHAVRGENGCILWAGNKNRSERKRGQKPYGRLSLRVPGVGHIKEYVHRLSWWLTHGIKIPDGHEIDHACEVSLCFNPVHVQLLTQTKNASKAAHNTNRKRAESRAREQMAEAA